MATFQFDLVSPEKLLVSGEVTQVDVPGSEGDFHHPSRAARCGHLRMTTASVASGKRTL